MRRLLVLSFLPLTAIGVAGCGNTVSTSAFKGEAHEVAQTIANLQAEATNAEEKKICTDDLAAALVTRLGGIKACEAAIKSQLTEVDSLEASVESVKVAAGAVSATAQVESVHEGKKAISGVSLVKEGGKWRISGVG
jgi:hypothetical protein